MGAVEGWEDPEAEEAHKQRAAAAARESARVQATCRAAVLTAAEAEASADKRDSEPLGTDASIDTWRELDLHPPPTHTVPDVTHAPGNTVTEAPDVEQVLSAQPGL